MNNFILNEKDIKTNFTQIIIEIYEESDLLNVIKFCEKYKYKYAYILHLKESEEKKDHYHFYIRSTSNHRFIISSLLTDTLRLYNFMKVKTSFVDFCKYVLHIEYDFKRKYNFDDIHFGFLDDIEKDKIFVSCLKCGNDSSDFVESFTLDNLTLKMFNHDFKNFGEIISFCSKEPKMRKYFLIHYRNIYDTWVHCFNDSDSLENHCEYF